LLYGNSGYNYALYYRWFHAITLRMGPQEDYIETVFTCEGDINDPNLHSRLEDFQSRLRELLSTGKHVFYHVLLEAYSKVFVQKC
jgi:hypothetical protein